MPGNVQQQAMSPSTQSGAGIERWRYTAFISYSHTDRAAAKWLHRSLEAFRVPAGLRNDRVRQGLQPYRLAPVFMDREELASSADLAASVQSALQQSQFLIVICSPSAAASRWVDEEIRQFRAMGRGSKILCLITRGEPQAARRGFASEEECLPPALREAGIEPAAADARRAADGRRNALIKLAAALLATDFDGLRQREQAHRLKRLTLISAAAAVACVAFASMAVAAWLARNEADRQRQIAVQKSLTAQRTTDFMISLFKVSDPSEARGNSITAREILDRGAQQLSSSLREEPLVRAELGATLGRVYRGLGLYGRAHYLLVEARAIPRQSPESLIGETNSLAELELQRGDDPQSYALFVEAERRLQTAGINDAGLQADVFLGRGGSAIAMGKYREARDYLDRALALSEQHALPEVHAQAYEGIAMALYYGGRLQEAEAAYDRAIAVRTALSGETHPKVLESLDGLGAVALQLGERKRAEHRWLRLVELERRVLGPKHPDVGATMSNVGRVRLELRQYGAARQILTEAADILSAQQGESHEDLMFTYSNLALAELGLGHLQKSVPLLQKALRIAITNNHALQGPIHVYLADVRCRQGSYRAGLGQLVVARTLVAARYGDEPWRMAQLSTVQADCLVGLGQSAAAAALMDANLPVLLNKWPPSTLFGHDALERAVRLYTRTGDAARVDAYRAQLQGK